MIILKIYSILVVMLMLSTALLSKELSSGAAAMSCIMFVPVLIYILFGGA